MPTPMPIMVASEVDQSGTGSSAAISPVSMELTARPARAARMGSPAATMEPNISSRMTAAASSPTTSDPIGGASSLVIDTPLTATVSPSWLASFAMRISAAADSCGMSSGSVTSSRRVATMVRPSAERAPGFW